MRTDQVETRLIGCPMGDCLELVTQAEFIEFFDEGECPH